MQLWVKLMLVGVAVAICYLLYLFLSIKEPPDRKYRRIFYSGDEGDKGSEKW